MKLSISRNVIIPRKWLLTSTPQVAINENLEQCSIQNFSNLNSVKIRPCPLISKQIYSGDRFVPWRSGYSFKAAHYLLTKEPDDMEDTCVIDVCKQVDSLDVTYRREAFRKMMIKQALIPGLKQQKILHFSNSATQSQDLPHAKPKKEEIWKCIPRKRALIGNVEKMLCIPDSLALQERNNNNVIDWSCNNMIVMGSQNSVAIYDDNGLTLMTWYGSTSVVKWSNDGNKLALCMFRNSKLVLYDIIKDKFLWRVTCKCHFATSEGSCVIRCICWSLHDRHIVTGCIGSISVYASDTGKLLRSTVEHTSHILNLSFSPNFNYLVSTARDRMVRVFTWPKLINISCIETIKPVKAIAWHPQESGLFCMGGRKARLSLRNDESLSLRNDGSLSLWNVNKNIEIASMRTKFKASVENLVWNKSSGELLVHWSYKKEGERYTIVPVLADFNRIVDVLSLNKTVRLSFMKFNATHEQLVTYGNDVFSIWNFFGNEKSFQARSVPLYNSTRRRQGDIIHNLIR